MSIARIHSWNRKILRCRIGSEASRSDAQIARNRFRVDEWAVAAGRLGRQLKCLFR